MGISLKNAVLSSLALVEVVAAAGLAGFALADDTLVQVSTAVSPRVAYDVTKQGDALAVVVAVEPFSSAASPQEPAGGVAVQLGAAADKKVVLTGDKPTQDANGSVRFTFRIPVALSFTLADGKPLGAGDTRENLVFTGRQTMTTAGSARSGGPQQKGLSRAFFPGDCI